MVAKNGAKLVKNGTSTLLHFFEFRKEPNVYLIYLIPFSTVMKYWF